MKITDCEIQKNKKRVSVFVDGEYSFSVTSDNYVLNGLYVGKEVTQKEIKKLSEEDERERAFSYVLFQLGYGAKTRKELIQKMNKQKYSEEAQNYALKKASEYGYVNDLEYCENFINQHKKMNGWGQQKIISELIRRGIDKNTINEKIQELYSEEDSFENAYRIAVKKYESIKDRYEERKVNQKIYTFLLSRGFSYDVCKNVIDKIKER